MEVNNQAMTIRFTSGFLLTEIYGSGSRDYAGKSEIAQLEKDIRSFTAMGAKDIKILLLMTLITTFFNQHPVRPAMRYL
jgi:hypothetical protein